MIEREPIALALRRKGGGEQADQEFMRGEIEIRPGPSEGDDGIGVMIRSDFMRRDGAARTIGALGWNPFGREQ